jgi:hypothetical protein
MITLIYQSPLKKMKIKHITATLAVLTALALPALSSANTYQYVDSAGVLRSTQVNTSTEALATASNIGPNSGVILVSMGATTVVYPVTSPATNTTVTNTGGSFYQFVDANGNVQSINAVNSSVALATAYNIGLHSGVVLVTNSTSVN